MVNDLQICTMVHVDTYMCTSRLLHYSTTNCTRMCVCTVVPVPRTTTLQSSIEGKCIMYVFSKLLFPKLQTHRSCTFISTFQLMHYALQLVSPNLLQVVS
jgi:hypothetical protein